MRDQKEIQEARQEGRAGNYTDIQYTGEAFEAHLQGYMAWERSIWMGGRTPTPAK